LQIHPGRCHADLQFNFILLGVLCLLLVLFSIARFVLTPKLGLAFFGIYVVFVT